MTLRVTVLAVVTGVAAVKLPERVAPVQAPVPPSKEYWAVPSSLTTFSKLTSLPQDIKRKDSDNANERGNKRVFFKIKYLRINSLIGGQRYIPEAIFQRRVCEDNYNKNPADSGASFIMFDRPIYSMIKFCDVVLIITLLSEVTIRYSMVPLITLNLSLKE